MTLWAALSRVEAETPTFWATALQNAEDKGPFIECGAAELGTPFANTAPLPAATTPATSATPSHFLPIKPSIPFRRYPMEPDPTLSARPSCVLQKALESH